MNTHIKKEKFPWVEAVPWNEIYSPTYLEAIRKLDGILTKEICNEDLDQIDSFIVDSLLSVMAGELQIEFDSDSRRERFYAVIGGVQSLDVDGIFPVIMDEPYELEIMEDSLGLGLVTTVTPRQLLECIEEADTWGTKFDVLDDCYVWAALKDMAACLGIANDINLSRSEELDHLLYAVIKELKRISDEVVTNKKN